jgi:hypothetical protein
MNPNTNLLREQISFRILETPYKKIYSFAERGLHLIRQNRRRG